MDTAAQKPSTVPVVPQNAPAPQQQTLPSPSVSVPPPNEPVPPIVQTPPIVSVQTVQPSIDGHPPIKSIPVTPPEIISDRTFKEAAKPISPIDSKEAKELEEMKKRVERVKIQVVDALGHIPNIEETIKSMLESASPEHKQNINLLLTLVHVLVILKKDSK